MFLEMGEFRVVHACYDQNAVDAITPHLNADLSLTDAFLRESSNPASPAYAYVETLLKGPEIALPADFKMIDKSDHARSEVRVKWWEFDGPRSLRNLALVRTELLDSLPDHQMPEISLPVIYPADALPVFFGHYSLCPDSQHPIQSPNTICLDFSGHIDPPITAYRWNGDSGWHNGNLIRI
jgi:hypothetical protein